MRNIMNNSELCAKLEHDLQSKHRRCLLVQRSNDPDGQSVIRWGQQTYQMDDLKLLLECNGQYRQVCAEDLPSHLYAISDLRPERAGEDYCVAIGTVGGRPRISFHSKFPGVKSMLHIIAHRLARPDSEPEYIGCEGRFSSGEVNDSAYRGYVSYATGVPEIMIHALDFSRLLEPFSSGIFEEDFAQAPTEPRSFLDDDDDDDDEEEDF